MIKPKFTLSTDGIPEDAKLILEVYLRPEGLAVGMTEEFRDILTQESEPKILKTAILEVVQDSLERASRVQ